MKIAFVVEFLELTGGHIAVVEIANRLQAAGHDVAIVYPSRSVLSRRNGALRRIERATHLKLPDRIWRVNGNELAWTSFKGRLIEVDDLNRAPGERFDAVVATAWRTAEAVWCWPARPRTIYFVQHYETWSGPADRVDATWRLPYELVVSSAWLCTLASERFGRIAAATIPYGVDHSLFHPVRNTRAIPRPRVGFLYHVEKWKGVADTLEAVEVAKSEREFDLVGFGAFDDTGDLPPNTELHVRPSRSELPAIYSSLDVFVCGSWSETGPMTVPEAMACGTPFVSTDVGNVRLWAGGDRGAWIVPPRRPDLLGHALADALDDPAERDRRAAVAAESISAFTWDRAADAFEEVLRTA
jgi:glycosyltransferase involved in cell wall biosynthesis